MRVMKELTGKGETELKELMRKEVEEMSKEVSAMKELLKAPKAQKAAKVAKEPKEPKEPKAAKAKELKDCPEGKVRNPITKRCIKDVNYKKN